MAKNRDRKPSSATMIAEVGVAAALSIVLGKITVYKMPQGGSVSLEMVPILFLAFYRGAKSGTLAGLVAGFVELVLGAEIVHPAQFILDYPLPMLVLGLAPVLGFGDDISYVITGTLGATFLRLLCHVASGMIFFSQYAPEGTPVWKYSAVYNATFLVPEMIVSIVVVAYLLKRGVGDYGRRGKNRGRRR